MAKTIFCKENGIIFSITTFTGESETGFFVKCLGHTWISIDNRTGHSVFVKDYELKNNEILTASVWAIFGHRGIVFNLEPAFIRSGRYAGRLSLSIPIDETQLQTVSEYFERNKRWTLRKNCSFWSVQFWNGLAGSTYALKPRWGVYTPKRLYKSMSAFACAELDKDFSRAEGIFMYHDRKRTEMNLCK